MKSVNRVKQDLKEGKTVVGAFDMIPSPDFVEMIGHAGFDFVILDTEHGRFSIENLEHCIRAAESVDLPPLVRVPNNPSMILHTLEAGCLGIQVPMVSSKEDALAVVKNARYAPLGEKGMAFFTRLGNWGTRGVEKSMELANEEVLVIIQIEGMKGVENLSEILTVEGIDVVFIGPMDLSQSLKVPGQVRHPKVQETIDSAFSQIAGAGLVPGTFAFDIDHARKLIEDGFKYITTGTGVIVKSLQEMVEKIKAD